MRIEKVKCGKCGGEAVKNGRTRHGRERFKCRKCGRQFVLDPKGRISDEMRGIIVSMIKKGWSVAEIIEVVGVSKGTVYKIKNSQLTASPDSAALHR